MRSSPHIILLFLFLLLHLPLHPQGIVFDNDFADVGDVRNWGLQPGVFHFTNHSDTRAFILRMGDHPDLKIIYPRNYIEPGQSDSILVYYVPTELNAFVAHLDVWTSDNPKPHVLTMVGQITSMDECPGGEAAPPDSPARLIRVVERETMNPVAGARVVIEMTRQTRYRDYTDRKGQYTRDLEPGQYTASIQHRDYSPSQESFRVNRNTRIIVLMIGKDEEVPEPELADNVPAPLPEPADEDPLNPPEQPGRVPPAGWEDPDEDVPLDSLLPYPGKENPDSLLLPWKDFRQSNIVFLIDVSSSMRSKDKLPLLKTSMARLVTVMRSVDNVSLIIYANDPTVLVDGAGGDEKPLLTASFDTLEAKGKTYGIRGLSKAYEVAESNFIPGANNLVIVATDGEFNSPDYSGVELANMVSSNARKGIHTSVVGFGQSNMARLRMRQIAALGKGSYLHIDAETDSVEEILVEEIRERSRRR